MAKVIGIGIGTARLSIAVCAAVIATLSWAPALAAERPSDKDVKELFDRVDNERDRFEDQLDGDVKHGILRGPKGEVNVGAYLDDLQENVDKLKGRFKSDYSAAAEVAAILRQGTDIQRFMSTQKPDFDGASEWNRLSTSLGVLAAVYGVSFPLTEGQVPRRMNDDEVEKAAQELAKSADRFKREFDASLKMDTTVDVATREAAVKGADDLKKDAEKLAETVDDGRPASGEAQALLQRGMALRAASTARKLSPAAQAEWGGVEGGLDKVAQAFNLPARQP